jgi:hypothetical protein
VCEATQQVHLQRMLDCGLAQRAALGHELSILDGQLAAEGVAALPQALRDGKRDRCDKLLGKIKNHTAKVNQSAKVKV